jgi:hypothetical protein
MRIFLCEKKMRAVPRLHLMEELYYFDVKLLLLLTFLVIFNHLSYLVFKIIIYFIMTCFITKES